MDVFPSDDEMELLNEFLRLNLGVIVVDGSCVVVLEFRSSNARGDDIMSDLKRNVGLGVSSSGLLLL